MKAIALAAAVGLVSGMAVNKPGAVGWAKHKIASMMCSQQSKAQCEQQQAQKQAMRAQMQALKQQQQALKQQQCAAKQAQCAAKQAACKK